MRAQCCLPAAGWARFHRNDVQKWSVRSSLSAKAVRAILISVGRGDGSNEDQYLIQRIDAHSLSSRGQILLALTDSGTAHWLSVYVVQAKPPYRELWHTNSIEQRGTCAEVDLGTESILGEPTASATADGRVLINVPERRRGNGTFWNAKTQLLVATYVWAGNTYKLKREDAFTSYGWNGNDYVTRRRGTRLKCARAPVDIIR